MRLIKGILESPTRLRTQITYNMEIEENASIETSDGVLVEKFYELSDLNITPQRGKGYIHYVNPQTKEQWYEEFDRSLTQEEQIEVQNEKIDLLLQMQMASQGII